MNIRESPFEFLSNFCWLASSVGHNSSTFFVLLHGMKNLAQPKKERNKDKKRFPFVDNRIRFAGVRHVMAVERGRT